MSTPPAASSKPFSVTLEHWLHVPRRKTVGGLQDVIAEKSFAMIFLVLMSVPALPAPTGGLTHVFEIVVLLAAPQMLLGRRTLWLPERLQARALSPLMLHKTLPKLVSIVRWFERFSRRRAAGLMGHALFQRVLAACVICFTLAAFFAVPFSGLDTLPSLGVVLISLGIILEDAFLALAGMIVGFIGIGITLTIGAALTTFLRGLF